MMHAYLGAVLIVTVSFSNLAAMAETFPYDHMHMTATDPDEAVAWYVKFMGGEDVGEAGRLKFGDTWFIFFTKDAGFPGSEGSTVDHIGFSFEDLDARMDQYREAGIKILAEPKEVAGKFKYAFVEDPWGAKIEVMEDHETLGFHHIHLRGAEPAKNLDWYVNAFGGERTKYKGMLDAVKYGPIWLLAMPGPESLVETKGRAIDHLGWTVKNMEKAYTTLTKKGVVFTLKPMPYRGIKIAFVEGPGGVRIELVER